MDDTPSALAADRAFAVTADGTEQLTRRQAAARTFVAPSRGVRYPADAIDPERAEWEAALIGSRAGAVLSGTTAAEHWGLPIPPWIGLNPNRASTVSVPSGGAHPDRRGVRGRRHLLPPDHVTEHLGLAVTTVPRTWLDCSAEIPVEHLIAMGDGALHRELATNEDLARVVHWAYRRRGVLAARRALPWLDARSESPGESLARAHLVLHGVPRPECNANIVHNGEWLARVDMSWRRQLVIAEYDGIVHLEEAQRRRDAWRRNRLQDAGWLVITLTADDLRQPHVMATQVKQSLAARTPR
jgi:hypothetical protein